MTVNNHSNIIKYTYTNCNYVNTTSRLFTKFY